MPPHESDTHGPHQGEGKDQERDTKLKQHKKWGGGVLSSWHMCETSWRLWNGSRPRPTGSRSRSSSVERPRTWAWKTERGKKETQWNAFFRYTYTIFRVELHRGAVVFRWWWSRTGWWGRWKRRDHWSMHTYYHYAPPPPQSQPATACGGNHGKSSGRHGLINGGNLATGRGQGPRPGFGYTQRRGGRRLPKSIFTSHSGELFSTVAKTGYDVTGMFTQSPPAHLLE